MRPNHSRVPSGSSALTVPSSNTSPTSAYSRPNGMAPPGGNNSEGQGQWASNQQKEVEVVRGPDGNSNVMVQDLNTTRDTEGGWSEEPGSPGRMGSRGGMEVAPPPIQPRKKGCLGFTLTKTEKILCAGMTVLLALSVAAIVLAASRDSGGGSDTASAQGGGVGTAGVGDPRDELPDTFIYTWQAGEGYPSVPSTTEQGGGGSSSSYSMHSADVISQCLQLCNGLGAVAGVFLPKLEFSDNNCRCDYEFECLSMEDIAIVENGMVFSKLDKLEMCETAEVVANETTATATATTAATVPTTAGNATTTVAVTTAISATTVAPNTTTTSASAGTTTAQATTEDTTPSPPTVNETTAVAAATTTTAMAPVTTTADDTPGGDPAWQFTTTTTATATTTAAAASTEALTSSNATAVPTSAPTDSPTFAPTFDPSISSIPTPMPTPAPTSTPTKAPVPTNPPSSAPTPDPCANGGCTWTPVPGASWDGDNDGGKFGTSTALSADGSTLIVGGRGSQSPGYVRAYRKNAAGVWSDLGQKLTGAAPFDRFGISVDVSDDGNRMVVGADGVDNANGMNSGVVNIYELQRSNNQWTPIGTILGDSGYDQAGWTVAMSGDGNVVAYGASEEYTRAYKWDGSAWIETGNRINDSTRSGRTLALSYDGTTMAVGLIGDTGVRTYELSPDGNSWNTKGSTNVLRGPGDSNVGAAVALSSDGNTLVFGGPLFNSNAGMVRSYYYDGSSWNRIGTADLEGTASGTYYGTAVALNEDGTVLAVGAPGDAEGDGPWTVATYVRAAPGTTSGWTPMSSLVGDAYAYGVSRSKPNLSVSLNGKGRTLAVGSAVNGEEGTDRGRVIVYRYG